MGDGERLLENFDSQLAWLKSVGSGEQWGSESRNTDEYLVKYRKKVERSEACENAPFSPDWIRAYVAEVEASTKDLSHELLEHISADTSAASTRVPVAAMILEAKSADYVRPILPEENEKDPFVFLHYLLSDRKTGKLSKGAGAALIKHARHETKKLGLKRLCADCWRGNDRKLVK